MSDDVLDRRLDALRHLCNVVSAPAWLDRMCREAMDMSHNNASTAEPMMGLLVGALNLVAVNVSRNWPITPTDLRIAVLLSEAARIAGGEAP